MRVKLFEPAAAGDRKPRRNTMTRMFGRDWGVVYGPGLREIVMDRSLSTTALRLWVYLVTRMDHQSWVPLRQTDVVRDFGLSRSQVSRAISELLAKGLIRVPRTQAIGWLIDPNYACRSADHIRRRQDGRVVFENEV